jgi:putative transposase
MSDSNDTKLTLNALDMDPEFKNPPEEYIQHTDRDSYYTAKEYSRALAKRGIKVSMSRKGNC